MTLKSVRMARLPDRLDVRLALLLSVALLPVGLIAGAGFQEFDCTLAPGDRLVILSDGVMECTDPANIQLGHDGVAAILDDLSALTGTSFLEALIREMSAYAGGRDFPDDVSAISLEFIGTS